MTKFLKIICKITAIVFSTMAVLFLSSCKLSNIENKNLIVYNYNLDKEIARFPIKSGEFFSISFIHSVNKTPVIDYYRFDDQNSLYVYKTTYYSFGAGVQTELNEGETIKYGDDGSMTIEHIDKKIDPLVYYLSSLYDHKLSINGDNEISLWDKCGKNIIIELKIK